MIHLKKVLKFSKSVFEEYPQLKEIWDTDLTESAILATKEYQTNTEEPGEVYLISFDEEVIGLTGWWPISDTKAGLRWHGIIPECRGKKFGEKALIHLVSLIPSQFDTLFEVTFNESTIKYFKNIGFQIEEDEQTKEEVLESSGGGNFVLRLEM